MLILKICFILAINIGRRRWIRARLHNGIDSGNLVSVYSLMIIVYGAIGDGSWILGILYNIV